jgi:hypothetical protein
MGSLMDTSCRTRSATRSLLQVRLYQRVVGNLAPYRDESVTEPLAGEVAACPAQVARRLDPVAAVAARRLPGKDWDENRAMSAGQALAVAQCLQAAGRAAGPDDQPADGGHRRARFVLPGQVESARDRRRRALVSVRARARPGRAPARQVIGIHRCSRLTCPKCRRPGFPAHLDFSIASLAACGQEIIWPVARVHDGAGKVRGHG